MESVKSILIDMFVALFESPDHAVYIADDPNFGPLTVDMSFSGKSAYTWGILKEDGRFVGMFQKEIPEWEFWGAAKGMRQRYISHYKLSALERGEKDIIDKALSAYGPLSKEMIPINARHSRSNAFTICGRSWYSSPLKTLFISVWGDIDIGQETVDNMLKGMGITEKCNILIQDGITMEEDEWEEWGNSESMMSPAIRNTEQEVTINKIKRLSELLHTADTGMKATIRNEIARLRSTLKDIDSPPDAPPVVGASKYADVSKRAGYDTPAEYNALRQQESVSICMTRFIKMFETFEQRINPVEGALSRRIMHSRLDLIDAYGLDAVMNAIEDVASQYEGITEIGSSDISGFVRQVEKILYHK